MSHPEGRPPNSPAFVHCCRAAAPQVTDRVLLLWDNTGRDMANTPFDVMAADHNCG